ncbi:uncharacterized protein YndB with AHSA1/START domain [Filimonas zeae]|uniref:ATPase n=1 Tax=Filimonas zeae TaxID=1737353 RepID=A0A917IYZ9_9BACT|nr:SRPBCC domain-containing protein [Filimonas zeae]MDR6339649.1 uncharacterized protein YndB with AHSA1/START domain [Filimonas zeae]GGH68968.1 ATPase [Filimonas zeae]
MEKKTKVQAGEGRQDILITREFDLPVELLFKAYTQPEIVAEWMGTKVVKLENKKHGSWQFETSDPQGNVVFTAAGTIHDIIPNEKIVRTFQMAAPGFDAQLEFLEFEALTASTSKLNMLIVYKSVAHRDQQLRLPFAMGLNMAHERLQTIASRLQ